MTTLHGNWNYQAFCPHVADLRQTPPRPALLAGVWTPPTVIAFATDALGKVTGEARLGTFLFHLESAVDVVSDGPGRVDLVATVERAGAPAVYRLQGYLIAGSDHVVGTVVSLGNDPALQPVGTSGPFVMYPVKP